MNTKLISVGGAVLALLAVLLVGNMVVNTTPTGVAKTSYEYKVVNLVTNECTELIYSTKHDEANVCIENIINALALAGWEYDSNLDALPGYFPGLFKKSK